MDLVTVLLVVLMSVGTAVGIVAIWALREFVGTARSVRVLTDDTRVRLIPLLDKADVTVDALNAELLRVDILVTRFEDVADRVSHTATTLHDIANAPERIAGGIAEKVRSWRGRRATSEHPGDTPGETPESSTDSEDMTTAPAADASVYDQPQSEDQWQRIG